MVPADSRGIPRVPRYSGYRPPDESLRVRGSHPLRPPFPGAFHSRHGRLTTVLQPRRRLDAGGLGSSAFARHYSRNHCYFLLLWVLRCFSSPRSPPPRGGCRAYARRVPHSETPGSRDICSSPGTIAAYRVLRRLREPRHPPSALAHFLMSRDPRGRGPISLYFFSLVTLSNDQCPKCQRP